MKLICELNDKIVLGMDGMSTKSPRITARAIVKRQDGLYAVMYADKFKLHSLPGGGVTPINEKSGVNTPVCYQIIFEREV